MLTKVQDRAGNEFDAVELRQALSQYAADIVSYWTKEFKCPLTALILMYVMEDQYVVASRSGSVTESKGYTVRALEARSGIPKSTVHRKLKHLEKLGLIELNRGRLAIASDEHGRSVLASKLPVGKTITDRHVNHIVDLL
jgi:DNA-binding MarR family transcriptional regulator